jgi:hypothetical protein
MDEARTTLKLSIALDPDFARTMTDEEAQQLGVLLKARARYELGETHALAAELGVDLDEDAK